MPKAASALLAKSAIYALPGIAVVIWLYHHWSSFKSLVVFIALTTLSLLAFFAMGALHIRSEALTVVATASLLISISGVIAMLIPYAAEIYPVHLRGTGFGRDRGEFQVRRHPRRGAGRARLLQPLRLVGAADRGADGDVGRDAAAQWHRDARAIGWKTSRTRCRADLQASRTRWRNAQRMRCAKGRFRLPRFQFPARCGAFAYAAGANVSRRL